MALLALGALIWRAWTAPSRAVSPSVVGSAATLAQSLQTATRLPGSDLTLTFDSIPSRPQREWLAAIAANGSRVRWTPGAGVRPLAMSAEPIADPNGRVQLAAIAPLGAQLSLRDATGLLDSASLGTGGVRVVEGGLEGRLLANGAGNSAVAAIGDSLVIRPVLVLARAGWEGKFVAAALEESGWNVNARFVVTPTAAVEQGAIGTIDTSRYSVVVALDGSASTYAPSIVRFARSGGGVVVAGEALRTSAFNAILPATPNDSVPATLGAITTESPREGLAATTFRLASPSAVVIERRRGRPTVVAARVALGRALALGYGETWRWRMMGKEGADAAHRAWWSALVSSVAYAPRVPSGMRDADAVALEAEAAVTNRRDARVAEFRERTNSLSTAPTGAQQDATCAGAEPSEPSPSPSSVPNAYPCDDPAPYAALIVTLGPPSTAAAATASLAHTPWNAILFALTLLGLLAEWISRRTRGVA